MDAEEWAGRAMVDRLADVDWRSPKHDAGRIKAAYQRWQTMLGLARPIHIITDPTEVSAPGEEGGNSDMETLGVGGFWPVLAGNPFVRSMWTILSPTTAPQPLPSEWDVASVWAYAFARSSWLAEGRERTHLEDDLKRAHAAVSRIVAKRRACLRAVALLNVPLLGLFDPPPMIAAMVRDLLVASRHDLVWRHLEDDIHDEQLAKALGIDTGELEASRSRQDVLDAIVSFTEPMIDACEGGAFAHVFIEGELVVLTSPAIWTDGRRLHRDRGPALAWRKTKVHAWKGCVVPERFILEPETLCPDDIKSASNEWVQRTLVDLYAHTHGHRQCMRDLGGVMVHEDHTGRLWCVNASLGAFVAQPGDIKIVEVENGTPEADGSRKTYWLKVPPDIRSACEAVAWTYGLTPQQYEGLVMRT